MSVFRPSESTPPPGSEPEPTLAKGAALGRYVVLDPLGQGAMGVVYRAFDPVLDRRIAVKLLRPVPAFATAQQERLLREGKAMARLSHPNVITVYDVGTYGDRVFVAMELVDGGTLRDWLAPRRSWREIVGAFVQAGRGLAAAHAAGIVHRDFKSDNALVGDDGRVRVLDFGLAWAPEGPRTGAETPVQGPMPLGSSAMGSTLGMGSMVGTPRYSSPEQLQGERVDGRADEFAFCASLWEALHKEPPFEGDDLLTLISNVQEGRLRPPTGRGIPGRVVDALRKGLSAQPADRFPTMDVLLQVLEHDPAVARRKWLGIGAAAAVALGGLTLAAVTRAHDPRTACDGGDSQLVGVWDLPRKAAVRQALVASGKPWAGETATTLSAEIDRYVDGWTAMHRETCEATVVRHEQSEALLDRRMQCLRDRVADVRALTALLSQPGDTLVESAPKAVYALTPLHACADTQALMAPVPLPRDPAIRAQADAVHLAVANVKTMNALGRYTEAEALAAELTPRAQALHYAPIEAEALEANGDALEYVGDFPRAVGAYHDALWAAERGSDRLRAASALINLVWVVGVDQGLHDRAHEYAQHAGAILAGLGGDLVLEAELAGQEASVLREERRLQDAEDRGREVIEKRSRAFGKDHPRYAMGLNNLAAIVADRGRYDEALALSREALAIRARTLGEHHPDYGQSLQNVAGCLHWMGREAEARPIAEQALAVVEANVGTESVRVASAERSLAIIEDKLGEDAAAEKHLRHAMAVAESLQGKDHPALADYSKSLGDLLAKEHRHAEAIGLYHDALRIFLEEEPDSQWTADTRWGLAQALLGAGMPADARGVLETLLHWQETNKTEAKDRAETQLALARALWATGSDKVRARRLAGLAEETLAAEPNGQGDLREATAFLDEIGRR